MCRGTLAEFAQGLRCGFGDTISDAEVARRRAHGILLRGQRYGLDYTCQHFTSEVLGGEPRSRELSPLGGGLLVFLGVFALFRAA